jgi:hypothetical protein
MREVLLVVGMGSLAFFVGFALVGRWYWWHKGFDAAEGVWIPAMKRLGDTLKAENEQLRKRLEKAGG